MIQAYADVGRDMQAVAIRRQDLAALELELKETRARARAGEVTQTDVAQAEAQLDAETTNVALADNQSILAAERQSAFDAVDCGPRAIEFDGGTMGLSAPRR